MKYLRRMCWVFNGLFLFLLLFICCSTYFINKIYGMVDFTQFLFFTRVNCVGGMNEAFAYIMALKCIGLPLFLTFLIFFCLKKLKANTECFLPQIVFLFYMIFMYYAAKRFWNFNVTELTVLSVVLIFLYVVNLNRHYSCLNILVWEFICSLFLFLCLHQFYGDLFVFSSLGKTNFYAENYVNLKELKNEKKRNVIVLFLESFNEEFRKAGNGLEVKDSDAIRFSDFIEGYAQRWTQGALFSAFTGTHIHYVSDYFRYFVVYKLNSLKYQYILESEISNTVGENFDFYTPRINSLGKIGRKNGYQNLFVQGSSIAFSGTKSFLLNNGFDEENIYGEENLETVLGKKEYQNWQGYKDADVFSVFKQKISALDNERPFFAVLFTMDLHIGDNSYFKSLENIKENTIQNLNDFIDWFKMQDFYDNTTLVVIGDHNRMGKNVVTGEKIYNAFFNLPENLKSDVNVYRSFNQIDMFPTILEIMGFKLPERKAGMGVSLFAKNKTLSERLSYSEQSEVFAKLDRFYYDLWAESGKLSEMPDLKTCLIAHAGGRINGDLYTNSLEALNASLQRGYKYVELDLLKTFDEVPEIVAAHDYKRLIEFGGGVSMNVINRKNPSKYTLLTSKDISDFFVKYPNLWLVTDKINDFKLLEEKFSKIKARMIVEVFSPEKYEEAKQYGFENVAYNIASVEDFSLVFENGYDRVTIWLDFLKQHKDLVQNLKLAGVKIMAYSTDNYFEVKRYSNLVDMFYYDGEEDLNSRLSLEH